MRATDLKTIRRQLEADLVTMTQRVRGAVRTEADFDGPGDEADEAQAVERLEYACQRREAAVRQVAALLAALARLTEGTYGHCESCGERIAPARLRAVPLALLCVGCQSRHEDVMARARGRAWDVAELSDGHFVLG